MHVMAQLSVDAMLNALHSIMNHYAHVKLAIMGIQEMTKLDVSLLNVKLTNSAQMINSVKTTCARLHAWSKTLVESMLSAQLKTMNRYRICHHHHHHIIISYHYFL
jgi:hypothetical protein